MSSLSIRRRETKSGHRFQVRYRLGGRGYPVVHGGSFETLKEARTRRDLIAGELAAGRNPADVLRVMLTPPVPTLTLERWRDRFIASRIDVDANTIANYRSGLKKACETFGERDPATITADEVAAWVAELTTSYKPGTIALYLLSLRMLFDFIGIEPNVARDPRVKKPKQVREEPQPPSAEHLLAILEAIGLRWRLLFVTVEQGALRLGEAVSLRWGDVDEANLRLRLPPRPSATRRAGSTCLSGWWRRSRQPVRSRIAPRSGASSRGSARPRPTRR
jgi:integrase